MLNIKSDHTSSLIHRFRPTKKIFHLWSNQVGLPEQNMEECNREYQQEGELRLGTSESEEPAKGDRSAFTGCRPRSRVWERRPIETAGKVSERSLNLQKCDTPANKKSGGGGNP